ncbi:hypothetical protein YC2023_015882 [Brassica napus]
MDDLLIECQRALDRFRVEKEKYMGAKFNYSAPCWSYGNNRRCFQNHLDTLFSSSFISRSPQKLKINR